MITGPSTGGLGDKGVDVMFAGNKGSVNCLLTELSCSATAAAAVTEGAVPATPAAALAHTTLPAPVPAQTHVTELSRTVPPSLPGGYVVGEQVVYTGNSKTFPSGDKLTRNQVGEVSGPATLEGWAGKGLAVMFPGNKRRVTYSLADLNRKPPPPPLPGGHVVGEQVFYTGDSLTFPSETSSPTDTLAR